LAVYFQAKLREQGEFLTQESLDKELPPMLGLRQLGWYAERIGEQVSLNRWLQEMVQKYEV
jgi:hypothetical protein